MKPTPAKTEEKDNEPDPESGNANLLPDNTEDNSGAKEADQNQEGDSNVGQSDVTKTTQNAVDTTNSPAQPENAQVNSSSKEILANNEEGKTNTTQSDVVDDIKSNSSPNNADADSNTMVADQTLRNNEGEELKTSHSDVEAKDTEEATKANVLSDNADINLTTKEPDQTLGDNGAGEIKTSQSDVVSAAHNNEDTIGNNDATLAESNTEPTQNISEDTSNANANAGNSLEKCCGPIEICCACEDTKEQGNIESTQDGSTPGANQDPGGTD
jgi:hypothetical protein